jgi:hypothetical protein
MYIIIQLLKIVKGKTDFSSDSDVDTPRLLHLYDGEGPPLERGLPKRAK